MGWDNLYDVSVARAYGSDWFREGRSAVFLVPSVIAPTDRNLVINLNHPDAKNIAPLGPIRPFRWDERLKLLLNRDHARGR